MPDLIFIQNLINQAIQSGGIVYIRYLDRQGNPTVRGITPLEWTEPGKILAFCHLRNEERHFWISNIQEISHQPFVDDSVPEARFAAQANATQSLVVRSAPRPIRSASVRNTRPPFNKITSEEDWSCLLDYFRECLNYEYQQTFSVDEKGLYILDLPDDLVYALVAGTHNLELKPGLQNDRLRTFIDGSRRANQQLCLGKSFFRMNPEKISPLLFLPVTVERSISNLVILKPEEYSLSYAALMNLGFKEEEIADFVNEFSVFKDNQPSIQEIEDFITQSLSERLSRPLPRFSHEDYSLSSIADYSIYDGTGLFWASSNFSGRLIEDLHDLKQNRNWRTAYEPLRYLFTGSPEFDHAPAPDFVEDERFYVTSINERQRKAARAVAEQPVTIITGPPGTGKSQLVLNLIAQAYLDGKTVLLASYNNQAVDVVMERLQVQTGFPGAIRTGNSMNRKSAVEQMESAISQIHPDNVQDFESHYRVGKLKLKKAAEQLDLIRDLNGRIQSYQVEKQAILQKLAPHLNEQLADIQLPYIQNDKLRLDELLSKLAEDFRVLVYRREQLTKQLRAIINDQEKKNNTIQAIQGYENQWGHFASGILHQELDIPLSGLIAYCQFLIQILSAVMARKELRLAQQTYQELKSQIDHDTEVMGEEQSGAVLLLENRGEGDFPRLQTDLNQIKEEYSRITQNRFSSFEEILIALHLVNPRSQLVHSIQTQFDALQIKSISVQSKNGRTDRLGECIDIISRVFKTTQDLFEMRRCQDRLVQTQSRFDEKTAGISQEILDEIDRLDLSIFDANDLIDLISSIEKSAREANDQLFNLLNRGKLLLVSNSEKFETVENIQKWVGAGNWDAFGLEAVETESQGLGWVQTWQKVVALWEANAVICSCIKQLSELPDESKALADYQKAATELFDLAGNLMCATWRGRSGSVPNEVFEGAKNYISAVRQLCEFEYGKNPELYRSLKEAERRNFPFALRMFPIWAITNLTARTNFPLDPGLFDLVIIDEASQCNVPSALPLLFRAKKVVIIGDPHQLRHVATLPDSLDLQIGKKYGIGLEAFSYNSHSLYDLGERSVGFHPGPILLNEHYRSDPRIITFSNEEFYGGQLVIKTDLTRRDFQREFLNRCGGVYWVDVRGDFQRPSQGSACNSEEMKSISIIVPLLLAALDRAGHPRANIGIVTPFRSQATNIQKWVEKNYPGSNRIKTGTAHQFQGDECDFIIFSPVLSSGIPDGTLNWLEKTYNLLNVAITRARVSLIVIGDFNFCFHDLPAKSRYHRLAEYVHERLNGVVKSIELLPVIGKDEGQKFEIMGTLLDPSNPEHNRTNLLRFITSCHDYIYWMDPYFDRAIIDLFDEIFDNDTYPTIHQIRLMTSEEQVMGRSPALRPDSIFRLQEFLSTKNVNLQMRVLPKRALPHDRLLYHPSGAINMPPFSGAFGKHLHLSEYTASSTTVIDFGRYWDKGIPIEKY